VLPDDLLRDAARRLRIIALLGAIYWLVVLGLDHLARAGSGEGPFWAALDGTDAIGSGSALVSLALFLYIPRGTRSPAFVLDLGLGYLMFTCFALGLVQNWDMVSPAGRPTWIGPVLLLFAALVPSKPRKTLVTGLIGASMNPLGMAIAGTRGIHDKSAFEMLWWHYPDYLLVGVAVVISYVVNRLGQQVSHARELGSYRLGDLLGRGGMGEVYRATHQMLARPAAIKLIRPEMLGTGTLRDKMIKQFHREAEAAATLRSPHTVALYDFGVTQGETLYFVMELLDGMDLETLVRDHGPVPANRAIHILRQVCHSLEEAHGRDLVHRDIKPGNIHIGRLGTQYDWVKVLDFGLVKSVNPRDRSDSTTTASAAAGTPDYMAPEISLGDPVDGRTDLYSLGCVAYFLLTGHRVFDSSSLYHAIARHLNDTPLPPSHLDGIQVPPALDRLVLACLAKNREERPRSALALDQDLAGIGVEPWGQAEAAAWWHAMSTPAAGPGERTDSDVPARTIAQPY
jgi:eukaryotic-like serine/threonine-protein kinase